MKNQVITGGWDCPKRRTLRVRNPGMEKLLDSLPVDLPTKRDSVRMWSDDLIAEVTRWSGNRRRGGLFGAAMLRRADADAALAKALSEVREAAND